MSKMNTSKPLTLKKINPLHARQYQRLFKYPRTLEFTLNKERYRFFFIPPGPKPQKRVTVIIQVNDRFRYRLGVQPKFVGNLLNDSADIALLQKVPSQLRNIAFEIILEELLDRFDQYCRCDSSVISAAAGQGLKEWEFDLDFKLVRQSDGTFFHGKLETCRDGMDWLLDILEQQPPIHHIRREWIPLCVYFEAGYACLPARELIGLEPNDIILLETKISSDKPEIIIRAGPAFAFYGRFDSPGRIVVHKKLYHNLGEIILEAEENMKPTLEPQIEEIPVQLVFQLGEKSLTLKDLINLQPGYIFKMENKLDGTVTIRANGTTIGHGELVEIGDRIGVRVLQFTSQSPAECL